MLYGKYVLSCPSHFSVEWFSWGNWAASVDPLLSSVQEPVASTKLFCIAWKIALKSLYCFMAALLIYEDVSGCFLQATVLTHTYIFFFDIFFVGQFNNN